MDIAIFFSNTSIVILAAMCIYALSSAVAEAYANPDHDSTLLSICLSILTALAVLPRLVRWLW